MSIEDQDRFEFQMSRVLARKEREEMKTEVIVAKAALQSATTTLDSVDSSTMSSWRSCRKTRKPSVELKQRTTSTSNE